MRNSAVLAVRRGAWCALPCAVLSAAPLASAAAPPVSGEAADDGAVIARHGDRGASGDYPEVRTSRRKSAPIGDSANSVNDVLNSGITEFGKAGTTRFPAAGNTLGYDSDVFDPRGALRSGADGVHVRLGSRQDTVWLGALFPRADVRR